jgi:uncharacterized OB-fold protein
VITLKTFFEEARAGRLTGIRCARCRQLAVPPKDACPSCRGTAWDPVPLDGRGTIASFTVIRVLPRGPAPDSPYALALVRLDEGVSLPGRIVDIPLDQLQAGLPVRFRPLVQDDETLVAFGPA